MTSASRLSLLAWSAVVGSVFAMASGAAAQTVIIKGTADGAPPPLLNNGSFEQFTDVNGQTLADIWQPIEFTNLAITGPGTTEYRVQSNGNQANDGTRSGVFGVSNTNDVGQAPGIDVGYTIQQGDVFTLSFDHRGSGGWDAGDELDWDLFFTDDGLITGNRTSVFSGSVQPTAGTYSSTGNLVSPAASALAAGQSLFLSFMPGAGVGDDGMGAPQNEFGRLDQVNLSVGGTPLIEGTSAPFDPGYVLNGSFEDTTSGSPDLWFPLEFSNPAISGPGLSVFQIQANGNSTETDGVNSQVIGVSNTNDVGQAPAIDTGYTIQQGDTFTLSFDHRGATNSDPNDEIDWELFYTSDNSIFGVPTTVASGSVNPIRGEYQSTGDLTSAPADAAAAGRTLFLSFLPGANVGETFAGDYNNNGIIDAGDYVVWRDNVGEAAGAIPNDTTGADPIGPDQYTLWSTNYGVGGATLLQDEFFRIDQVNLTATAAPAAIPEPHALLIAITAIAATVATRRSV